MSPLTSSHPIEEIKKIQEKYHISHDNAITIYRSRLLRKMVKELPNDNELKPILELMVKVINGS